MLKRDYDTAVSHLELAYGLDRDHRGIAKVLGYSYVWAGDLEAASVLLAEVPEATNEMDVYTWWWDAQGREDLASRAEQMTAVLRGMSRSG
jgi:hypothetical protein